MTLFGEIISPILSAIGGQSNKVTGEPACPTWISEELYHKAFDWLSEYMAPVPMIHNPDLSDIGIENFMIIGVYVAHVYPYETKKGWE